jgi:hypothetical protein
MSACLRLAPSSTPGPQASLNGLLLHSAHRPRRPTRRPACMPLRPSGLAPALLQHGSSMAPAWLQHGSSMATAWLHAQPTPSPRWLSHAQTHAPGHGATAHGVRPCTSPWWPPRPANHDDRTRHPDTALPQSNPRTQLALPVATKLTCARVCAMAWQGASCPNDPTSHS